MSRNPYCGRLGCDIIGHHAHAVVPRGDGMLVEAEGPFARPLLPLWLCLLRVLELHPAGLSADRTARIVDLLTGGMWHRRPSILENLAQLREAGALNVREEATGERPAKIHTLSAKGRVLLEHARAEVARIITLPETTNTKDGTNG